MPRSRSKPNLYLLSKVGTLYHLRGQTQQEIADHLNISRPKVSRLLREAQEQNIVRITVTPPSNLHLDLEDRIEELYGLREAMVVSIEPGSAQAINQQIGTGAANYLARTLQPGEAIGIGWGTTLDAMVQAMHPSPTEGTRVVQALGGIGPPESGAYATGLVRRLADLLGASAVMLPAPGIVGTVRARNVLRNDPHVQLALQQYDSLDVVFTGVGSPQASVLLRDYLPRGAFAELELAGAVGHVALRFFDADGRLVRTSLDERTLSISPEQMRKTKRVVAMAGGPTKVEAIRAALKGGFVNVLITDQITAEALVDD